MTKLIYLDNNATTKIDDKVLEAMMPYLKEEYAKKLMYEPILYNGENRYKDGALDRLYELTSGSAYLIMNLCAGLVDYLNEKHSRYITKAHIDDYINKLLKVFAKIADNGATLIVIEHNLDIIKSADYIIDLGPDGGDKGGSVVACGTPEEVAQNPNSYTGQYLKKIFTKEEAL